jgi:hypothetical protein
MQSLANIAATFAFLIVVMLKFIVCIVIMLELYFISGGFLLCSLTQISFLFLYDGRVILLFDVLDNTASFV